MTSRDKCCKFLETLLADICRGDVDGIFMARIYGASDAKSVDTLKGNLEAALLKISILFSASAASHSELYLPSLIPPSLLTEIEQISPNLSAPVIGAIYVETNPGFLFSHCVHLSAFGRVCRPNKISHLSIAKGTPAIISLSLSSSGAHKGVRKNAI